MPNFNFFKAASNRYAGHPFRVLSAAIKTIFVGHIVTQYAYTIQPTQGASMLPTIEVMGDWILISRYYRRGRGVTVGDLVTFDSVREPDQRVVKRVLGMPGDYVLRDTPGESNKMLQVPEGHCWVGGDNLPYSSDSRHFGPVPMALIKGKVLAVALPWSERRWIDDELHPVQ